MFLAVHIDEHGANS